MFRPPLILPLALAALCLAPVRSAAQNVPDYEKPPVAYSATKPTELITRLQQRIEAGELRFAGSEREILAALLREVKVPVESQIMVFSRTSLQRGRIRPSQPRALYFSDSMYIGWVPGGLMEVASVDPQLGPVFYAFDPHAKAQKFERDADCLRCHGGAFVRDVPDVLVRSVFPDAGGEPLLRHGSEVVDDETPFERRWGGWYVTGYTGQVHHRGNAFAREQAEQLIFDLSDTRPTELSAFFDVSRYLAPTSDVVALLVFEHQMTVQNALTHAAHSCRKMLEYQRALQVAMKDPLTDEPAYDSVKSVFAGAVDSIVDKLLFRHAAPLPAGVTGDAAFQKAFAAAAKRAPSGDSLRDLQLRDRVFALRCSYMIHSATFAALPPQLKTRVLERLRAVLKGNDPRGRYAYLPADERARIAAVLAATLPEFTVAAR